jgi:hypothetical protein
MTEAATVAGWLLVAGPALGTIALSNPALVKIWTGSREFYLASIDAHRWAWYVANAGFATATLLTTAGLAVLAGAADVSTTRGALLLAAAVVYALGGVPWLMIQAIRALLDLALARMIAAGEPTQPAESLLGALTSGLFGSFVLTTAVTLIALAAILACTGGVAVPVAVVAGVVAALVLLGQLLTRDTIPAFLYGPTLLIGIALLAGWT